MKKETPQAIYLKDYKVSPFLVAQIDLTVDLEEDRTMVRSRMQMARNPKSQEQNAPLVLQGEQVELVELSLNGRVLAKSEYMLTEESLTLPQLPAGNFTLESLVKIHPETNTSLEGLYRSSGIFCTQCEAEGFRRITYYLDRPDVMAKFSTTITADKAKYPVLLSNGNLVEAKPLADGRHVARWVDPFPKPCYLFALVAGDLGMREDHFVTRSGRKVTLQIYVNKGNEARVDHAMASLKKSMKWDEDRFGLEYDLDIFMIVAVDDFNAGAMENKGLNIFNASYVLANAATATDDDYNGIEGVVAHEYFHNWTGNRVTCRDWFQLSLKEGLTVYRDSEFTSDMNSRAVKRIDDVMGLRLHQFAEDAGPMAHPVRPQSYIEINNFYTSTVYEKGSEVIRMIATLIGRDNFRKGMDKYFELYDGQAVTTDDFVHAMELASGVDLTQFRRWYHQAGTPRVKVVLRHEAASKRAILDIIQSCPATPGQVEKQAFHIPFLIGLLDGTGKEIASRVLSLTKTAEEFVFDNIAERPRLSLNRNFSAPIHVDYSYSEAELLFLLAHDRDPFARWEAGQRLAGDLVSKYIKQLSEGKSLEADKALTQAFGAVLADRSVDPAFCSQVLHFPSEEVLAQAYEIIPVDEIHVARNFLKRSIALENEDLLFKLYQDLHKPTESYAYTTEACGRRAFKNTTLVYLCLTNKPRYLRLAEEQALGANNMTDAMGALEALNDVHCPERENALADFYRKWNSDSLVINKWFRLQAGSDAPQALERIQKLMHDPAFSFTNPNKMRSLVLAFAYFNKTQFHDKSGKAYSFYADQVLAVDQRNPQLASQLMRAFQDWKRMNSVRQNLIRSELERMLKTGKLSPGVYEKVSKFLES